MTVTSVLQEVVADCKIVGRETFDVPWYPGEAIVTQEIREENGGTMVTVTICYESKIARDAVLKTPMTDSMGTAATSSKNCLVFCNKQHRQDFPMRKLIVCNIVSLDGFFSAPNGNVMAMPFDNGFSTTTQNGFVRRIRFRLDASRTRVFGPTGLRSPTMQLNRLSSVKFRGSTPQSIRS